jgi:hypothetical protein
MRRPFAVAALLTLGVAAAGVWWLYHSEPGSVVESVPATSGQPAPATRSTSVESPPASSDAAKLEELPRDPELIRRVEQKYRFLFADLRLTAAQLAQLRELLLEQQQLRDMLGPADDPDLKQTPAERARLERALAAIDARIRALIDAAQFARYETLRESDVEQGHLAQFSGGVSALAPLNPQQERLILEARLRHKERFEAGMRDFGLDRASLSDEERLYAHRNVTQALNEYRDNFLTEVRPALTEDQYFLLSSYETTEFARELERLQVLINSK